MGMLQWSGRGLKVLFHATKIVFLTNSGSVVILEEKPSIPQEHSHLHLHSKGFFPEIEVQDFPVRGKAVYLRIKRRRWEDPETGQTYSHDWKRGQGKERKL